MNRTFETPRPIVLTPLVFLWIALACLWTGTSVAQGESEVFGSRPVPADGGPTVVSAELYLVDLYEINGAQQDFYANFYIFMSWNDPRIADGSHQQIVDLDEAWNPRLQLVNQRLVQKTMPDVLKVDRDGNVEYRQRFLGRFSQRLDLSDFPTDDHDFQIQIVAAGFRAEEVVFALPNSDQKNIAASLAIADWEISDASVEVIDWQFVPGRTTSMVVYEFHGKRFRGYYIWKVVMPLVLIVMMSWGAFWIDPTNAGSQIGLATSSMLTLIAYRFMLESLVPKLSYLTRMDFFILGSTVMVFLTLIQVLLTSNMARMGREVGARTVDRWARFAFPAGFLAVWWFSLG